MMEMFRVNKKKITPIMIVASMSNGKSTLINSLIGTNIFPSKNAACTAKTVFFLDNDSLCDYKIHKMTKEGKYTCELYSANETQKQIELFNSTEEISELLVEGQIEGVRNHKKSLMIVDTPGPNNSIDSSHSEITLNLLEKFNEGIILYVLNAAQICTTDESDLLKQIKKHLEKHPKLKIVFIVNKLDMIDSENENINDVMKTVKEYIDELEFVGSSFIPVSAHAALLIKKILNQEKINKHESIAVKRYLDTFENKNDYCLPKYCILADLDDYTKNIFEDYTIGDLKNALYNTGILTLEKYIDEYIIYTQPKNHVRVKETSKGKHKKARKKGRK